MSDRIGIAAVFTVLLAGAIYQGLGFNRAAQILPLIIAIPTFLLSLAVLVTEIRMRGQAAVEGGENARLESIPPPAMASVGSASLGPESEQARPGQGRRELVTIAWLFGLVLLIWLFGILWSIPLFLILFLWLDSRESWRMVIGLSLGTWAAVYLLFIVVLNMQLYDGVLARLLR